MIYSKFREIREIREIKNDTLVYVAAKISVLTPYDERSREDKAIFFTKHFSISEKCLIFAL